MPEAPEAHRLGPHVVGTRVVVRRVLPGETGPSGGPAMTDVLGVCLRWSDGECVVQPDGGPAVTIPWRLIVSGKPVPRRPSVRHRVSPLEAQLRALALWPDLTTEPVGDWLLRRCPTSTARRVNSVLAFVPAGVDDAYERVVAHYPRPIAAVLPGSAEDELFHSHGWGPESHDADTLFQVASVARALRTLRGARPLPVELVETSRHTVTARVADIAHGVAGYDRDWVGLRSLEVVPGHRRQGFGSAVMAALLGWGAERGATTAYLQVLGDNTAALTGYERLGFATHHRYRYLAPSPE